MTAPLFSIRAIWNAPRISSVASPFPLAAGWVATRQGNPPASLHRGHIVHKDGGEDCTLFPCFFSRQYIFRAVELPEIPAEPRVVLSFKTVRPKRAYILFIRPTAFTYFHNRLRNNCRLLRRHHTFPRNGQDCIPFLPDAGRAAPCPPHGLQILFPQIHASGNRG